MTITKRCSLCKKPALINSSPGSREKNWICSACRARIDEQLNEEDFGKGGELCGKCKNSRNGSCRFRPGERQKVTACSDWVGRKTEHNKRRWAKFEN